MPFAVVGANSSRDGCSPVYRGTYRQHPPHGDHLSAESEYNQLFYWYSGEAGESGVVSDLANARRMTRLLHDVLGRPEFELIEVGYPGDARSTEGECFGYDISAGFSYSLLSWGLAGPRGEVFAGLDGPLRLLVDLLEAHFRPKLNAYGLFDDAGTAAFCNRSMEALQQLSPNLWEGGDWNFEVVFVCGVSG